MGLSDFAKDVLKAAAINVFAGGKGWTSKDARDRAEMADALQTLESDDLTERSGKDSYRVTSKGYKVADELVAREGEMSIVVNAAVIAKYLAENSHFHQNTITVATLMQATKISLGDFNSADQYLLQKGYTKGTMGGDQGWRWLTAEGIDFAETQKENYDPGKEAVEDMPDPRKVFVVHGRNEQIRSSFFDLLRSLDLSPMEWSQALALTGKASPYVGEVLEAAFANARAVVVLLTPDDEVRLTPKLWSLADTADEKEYRGQARPNVLFEAGMAFGKNPERTLLTEVGRVKTFSDIWGRHVVKLNNSAERRKEIANRLRTAGCAVADSGTDWLGKGNFEVEPVAASGEVYFDPRAVPAAEKIVDMNYPQDIGLKANLESAGYEVRWCMIDKLSRMVDIEGWSRATIKEGDRLMSLRIQDKPFDQVLIIRKKKG